MSIDKDIRLYMYMPCGFRPFLHCAISEIVIKQCVNTDLLVALLCFCPLLGNMNQNRIWRISARMSSFSSGKEQQRSYLEKLRNGWFTRAKCLESTKNVQIRFLRARKLEIEKLYVETCHSKREWTGVHMPLLVAFPHALLTQDVLKSLSSIDIISGALGRFEFGEKIVAL